MIWSVIHVRTWASCSNFIDSWVSHQNSIKFYWNSNPIFFFNFIIQILHQILKSTNKESCSLLQILQNHILFDFFWNQEVHVLIESSQFHLKKIREDIVHFRPTQSSRPISHPPSVAHAPTFPSPCTGPRCASPVQTAARLHQARVVAGRPTPPSLERVVPNPPPPPHFTSSCAALSPSPSRREGLALPVLFPTLAPRLTGRVGQPRPFSVRAGPHQPLVAYQAKPAVRSAGPRPWARVGPVHCLFLFQFQFCLNIPKNHSNFQNSYKIHKNTK
jgi:hypothetical protein